MRRKTYAYNSITIGILVAFLVYLSSKSIVLTILAGLGVAVVGFFLIRMLENAAYKGVDKAAEKVSQAYQNHKAQKAAQAGVVAAQPTQFPSQGQTTQFPTQTQPTQFPNQPQATQFPGAVPQPEAQPIPQPAQPAPEQKDAEFKFCPYCGAQIKRASKFCPACGAQSQEN
jgi:hypothetical protein